MFAFPISSAAPDLSERCWFDQFLLTSRRCALRALAVPRAQFGGNQLLTHEQ
jgi:hypothetical protein